MKNVVDDFPTAHMVVQPGFTLQCYGEWSRVASGGSMVFINLHKVQNVESNEITLGQ